MKKVLILILALVMTLTLFLTACGSGSGGSSNEEAEETTETAEEAEEPAEAEEEAAPEEATEEVASDGGTFIVRAWGDPLSFNPDLAGDDYLYPIAKNIYQRLCGLDFNGTTPVPEAAESWEYNDDATQLTFHLRQDLVWSDGNPLTSKDVKYTFETIKNNPAYFFSATMQNVDSIEIPDDYTVVMNLVEPDAAIVNNFAWYGCFILSEAAFNSATDWEDASLNETAVTCGPFTLGEYKRGESIEIVRDDNFPEPAKLDRVIFSMIPDDSTAFEALKNGEIDLYESIPSAYEAELATLDYLTAFNQEYVSPIRMVFNFNDEDLQSQAVRKAIAMAINREDISQKVYAGTQVAEYNMYPSNVEWATNSEVTCPAFDIEGARKVLEDAGFTADADGYYITGMEIMAFEGYGYPDVAKLIAATMTEAGIQTEALILDGAAWEQNAVDRKYKIALLSGGIGPDPAALKARIMTGVGGNFGDYSNAKVDELLIAGSATGDQEKRAEIYREMQAVMVEDPPYLPVLGSLGVHAHNSSFSGLPYQLNGEVNDSYYGKVEYNG